MADGSPGSLAGRVVVVTGGTRGIGHATSDVLARAGATVVITGRDEVRVKAVAAELSGADGLPVTGVAFDIADFDAVGAAFKAIAAQHGRLDGLVANAGIVEDAMIGMIRPGLVERVLATNVAGTIASVQAAARVMMRKGSGSIVVLSSIVGEYGSIGQTAYAASKAAVASVARSAAKELGPRGIRVNAVAPGPIWTPLVVMSFPADKNAEFGADTPLGRPGQPGELAPIYVFLATEASQYISGEVVGATGGKPLH
jgi:3-oxoacyl-[acyl-carrier protein] reductase